MFGLYLSYAIKEDKLVKRQQQHPHQPYFGNPSQLDTDHHLPKRFGSNSIFPEAVELIGSLDKCYKTNPIHRHHQFPRDLISQIERHCASMDSPLVELVDNILSDFGEWLLLRGPLHSTASTRMQVYSLLYKLYQAKGQTQFLRQLRAIQQFCRQVR